MDSKAGEVMLMLMLMLMLLVVVTFTLAEVDGGMLWRDGGTEEGPCGECIVEVSMCRGGGADMTVIET